MLARHAPTSRHDGATKSAGDGALPHRACLHVVIAREAECSRRETMTFGVSVPVGDDFVMAGRRPLKLAAVPRPDRPISATYRLQMSGHGPARGALSTPAARPKVDIACA